MHVKRSKLYASFFLISLNETIVQEHMSKIWVPWEFREESKQLD